MPSVATVGLRRLLTVMAISDGNGGRKRSVLKSDKTSSCGDAVFTCREKVSLEDQPNAKRTLTQNRTRAPIAIMTRALFCCRSRAIICAYCGLLSTVALAQYIVQVLQIEFYFIRVVSPSLHHNSATSNWWRARIVGGVLIYICNPS